MTSYDVKILFTSVPVDPPINIVNKITIGSTSLTMDQHVHTIKSQFWSFASKRQTSSSKVNIMNRSMVLPWVVPLGPSLPTCLWKSSKSMPLALPHTPSSMAKVCEQHLCHPAGKTQSTITTTHELRESIYTVYCRGTKPRRNPTFPGHFGFFRPQQLYSLQSTENLLTPTNTYTGTAIISSQPKTVFSIL